MSPNTDRYARQRVLPQIGADGQQKILRSSVLLVGCGALGSVQATLLARAGIGKLRIVDRDIVEENNLQRQLLFDEDDARLGLPKAVAAVRKLRRINSTIALEAVVADLTSRNIEELMAGTLLVMDGTDNFETRYLINDACVKHGRPWVYGGVIGTSGMTLAVLPKRGPCLRCTVPIPPPPASLPTCETAGVLSTASCTVASFQVTKALRIVVDGHPEEPRLEVLDPWRGEFRSLHVTREPSCCCCGQGRFQFLEEGEGPRASVLCGRNAVQISPGRPSEIPLARVKERLEPAVRVSSNGLVLQFKVGEYELVIFPDGRTIVRGTTDVAQARRLHARYIGG